MKKRILSLLLVFCMVITMIPLQISAAGTQNTGSVKNPFSDVKRSDWFYEAVMYTLQNGLFNGTSDTSFSPNSTLTRAMYVTVMGRIAEINPARYDTMEEFSDVPSNIWYAPYVKWALEKGITTGVGNGKFNPNGLITREQMATLTVRFFDAYNITYPEATVTGAPADLDSVSDYAREAVLKLWRCGFFKGENGNFNPKKNVTRAEAAVFSYYTDEAVEKWFIATGKKTAKEEEKEVKYIIGPSDDESHSYTVSFMDGENQLDRLSVKEGQPLSLTPSNKKTAKDGYIFIGWFTDKECTAPFYAEDLVTSNLTVYAKYEEMAKEELRIASFAQMDQTSDISFTVQRLNQDAGDVYNSIVLSVMDGTEPVELDIIDHEDGTYTVKAKDGFREGSSYNLTLGEGYIFKDKAESIRTASFSIKKEEVDNLALNEGILYIRDTDEMSYIVGGADPVDVLNAVLMNSKTTVALIGTFDYADANMLRAGDILCIYETVDPRDRDYINCDYSDDAEAYIEVIAINGNTVTFTSLDETDADKVIFIPDTIPFSVEVLPAVETGFVDSTTVDQDARINMGLDTNPEVKKGDFVVFYVGSFADLAEDSEVYYGVVTNIDGSDITYKRTTKDDIEKTMDTFLEKPLKGDEILEGVDEETLISQIEEQVRKSGFAEDAAEYLALMATQTDGFKTMSGLTDFSITDEKGNLLTAKELELMGIGANIELSDDVSITVELDKSSKYFNDGIRLALGIKAEFSVDMGEDGEIKIELAATFIEEIAIDIQAGAKAKVKWYFIIPKFKELSFRTSVDLKNYAGISIDVKIYTVQAEEESVWDKLKGIKDGQFKEIFEKIEDVKDKISQAKETVDKIQGYKEDLEALWASIPSDLTNKAEYDGMLDTLGELNITQELMDMLNLTNETELDAGVRNLMERYSEMLENESDWVEILNKEIFRKDIYIKIFAISISADFVIKGNINIALGANMEYVVGKRYSFWFDIISKTSGNSEMDLLDEKFAFQFYVMGKLGLKMGVRAEIAVGVISTKIGSIGVTAEFGPYVELWGYFVYEYTKLRPANTATWNYDERMMGALYLEFGLYLEMKFKAQAFNNLFKYEPTLLDKKWPLLTAGVRNNVYDFAYEIEEDEVLPVKDADGNSANGITMTLPESYRQMKYIDLCEGNTEQAIYEYGKFNYTLSNRNFAIDESTGEITVTVPEGVQYMKCDLTLTWKSDKLAFSLYDLSVTIPLVWTNLSTEELNERYTVSVRVGNEQDGYTTVWSKRVIKNDSFDLPTEDEIKALLNVDSYAIAGYGNLKYGAINGYNGQATEGLAVLRDESYYFDVTPKTYVLIVKGVENADGTKEDKQFTAKFGEAFNLSTLAQSGTNDNLQRKYTGFLNVTVKDSTGNELLRDVTEPIGKVFASDLLNGSTYTATYKDNSAIAVFRFEGVDIAPIEVKMKKGDVPSSEFFANALNAKNAIIKSITPTFAPMMFATTYTIVCEVQEVPVVNRTITYDTKGGSEIQRITYPVGSLITKPTDPIKTSYKFDGWYSDSELTQAFAFNTMPDEDITLYAKWSGNEYTVTFDANEGAFGEGVETTKAILFDEKYGPLPVPIRTGFGFAGWYTDRTAGENVTEDTIVTYTGHHTLYARWNKKAAIDASIISFDENQSYDYNQEHHPVVFATGENGINPDSFKVEYKRQVLDGSWGDTAINAGTYDVRITRAEDDTYDSFEKTFTNVMIINKIARTITENPTGTAFKANLMVSKLSKDAYPGDGVVEYAVSATQTAPTTGWRTSRAFMNLSQGSYYIFVRVLEGENYFAAAALSISKIDVAGINVNDNMGYNFIMTIKTGDIDDAGTDSIINGRYYYLDGASSDLTHFDSSGDDFEKGDLDTYLVNGANRVPWMIKGVEIDYTKKGSKPGWYCGYVQPSVYVYNYFQIHIYTKIVEGEKLQVNQWFGAEDHNQDHVVWNGSTGSMKRKITEVGNFYTLPENIQLSSSNAESYTFTYDGEVLDQYGYNFNDATFVFEPKPYNAYDYFDAPMLSITASDKAYEDTLNDSINSFTIDKGALYAAMKVKGETEITLTVTLQFPMRSTTAETATYTKIITVNLAD